MIALSAWLQRSLLKVRGEDLLVWELLAAVGLLLGAALATRWLEARARRATEDGDEAWWRPLLLGAALRPLVAGFALLGALDLVHLVKSGEVLRALGAVLDAHLFDIGGKEVTLATVVTVVVVVVLSFWVSALIRRRLAGVMRAQGVTDQGSVAAAGRLAHYVVVLLGFGVGLQTGGIDLSALFAAGAVFAIGIGFAMQTLAQNFVAGVLLILEGTIKPGDIIQVGGRMVRVVRMGIRTTVVRDTDDVEAIVPNSDLVVNQVQNYTLSDRLLRVRLPVGVAYGSDLRATTEALTAAAETVAEPGVGGGVRVVVLAFGPSSIDFEVSIWTDDPWALPQIRSRLLLAVNDALAERGLVIAFPQLDIHFDVDKLNTLKAG
jgi:small-conductance mechanosensitive channel